MARTAHSARKSTMIKKETKAPEPVSRGKTSMAKKALSIKTPVISQQAKPKKAVKRVSKNVLKEIKYYQANVGFLVPKATIVKTVRAIMMESKMVVSSEPLRFTSESLNMIHEAIENHLVCLLELAYMAARHAKRVTLFASDIRLIHRIKRNL
ncbi:histone H3 [Enteropsectra breve]|nr:histone H3 [Enteropsectra breve]